MANVIVAFSRQEDARSIKNILVRNGFEVTAVCTSGAQVLAQAENLGNGIVVCGYRLTDMLFAELRECLTAEFSILMLAVPGKWNGRLPSDTVYLQMPLKVHDLVETLEMMQQAQSRKRRKRRQQRSADPQRSSEQKELLMSAKKLLMERNGMTEEEAHRYIQKCSMDSGTNMIETAQMVISLITL